MILGAIVLTGLGVGAATAAVVKRRSYGRLRCAEDAPIVGVPLDYHGDWWADRGRRLYWRVRRSGGTTGPGIARGIIGADIGDDPRCMAQFPPHADTHPRNVEFWRHLLDAVYHEMNTERMAL